MNTIKLSNIPMMHAIRIQTDVTTNSQFKEIPGRRKKTDHH